MENVDISVRPLTTLLHVLTYWRLASITGYFCRRASASSVQLCTVDLSSSPGPRYATQLNKALMLLFSLDDSCLDDMQIFVRGLDGKRKTYTVKGTTKISQVKRSIQEKEGIPAHRLKLMYAAKLLEDNKTLLDYGINESTAGQTLHVSFQLPGAAVCKSATVGTPRQSQAPSATVVTPRQSQAMSGTVGTQRQSQVPSATVTRIVKYRPLL